MADNQAPIPTPPSREPVPGGEQHPRSLADAWREVGEQLRELGNRLAQAFRVSWSAERSADQEEAVRNLRDDLRSAADRLDRVMRRVAEQTEAPRTSAFRATRAASERSVAEAREAAISSLRGLNRQLELLADRLEEQRRQESGSDAPSETPPDEETSPPRS